MFGHFTTLYMKGLKNRKVIYSIKTLDACFWDQFGNTPHRFVWTILTTREKRLLQSGLSSLNSRS